MNETADRPRQQRNREDHRVLRVLFGFVWAVLVLSAGWWLAHWIFAYTGTPPDLVGYLVSIACGIMIAGLAAWAWGRISGRHEDDPDLIWGDLGEALDRIARGDFSVRLRQPKRGVLADVVASVNKMAAGLGSVEQQRQEFISNVSHEIQSPLTSIAGFADLLRDEDLDPATRQHYLDVIRAEAARLSRLSDNLLRLSSLDSTDDLERERFRLDEQVRSVVLMLEPQWSAKGVDVELSTTPVEVDADADMLRQVWINLVQNAVKYTPAHGSVRVVLTAASHECRLEVADTGLGIESSDLPRVFERFFRADKARSGDGNGLGLALVKRVVDLHGGQVAVTSEPGKGSTFTVTLPL